jgi:hypothetical protein
MPKPIRISPASLRSAASRQRVAKPHRFGNTVCQRTIHWDSVIVRRQQAAIQWREELAARMEADGVTELRASTLRLAERPSLHCPTFTVTVYAYADGSVYLYRHGNRLTSPATFRARYADFYTVTPDGQFGYPLSA